MKVLPKWLLKTRSSFLATQDGKALYEHYKTGLLSPQEHAAFWWGTLLIPIEEIPKEEETGLVLMQLDPNNQQHINAWNRGHDWFLVWLDQ